MKAYKCDICGNLYEHEKESYLVVDFNQQKRSCSVTYLGVMVDVCPDCIQALQTVINERKNKNVQ